MCKDNKLQFVVLVNILSAVCYRATCKHVYRVWGHMLLFHQAAGSLVQKWTALRVLTWTALRVRTWTALRVRTWTALRVRTWTAIRVRTWTAIRVRTWTAIRVRTWTPRFCSTIKALPGIPLFFSSPHPPNFSPLHCSFFTFRHFPLPFAPCTGPSYLSTHNRALKLL